MSTDAHRAVSRPARTGERTQLGHEAMPRARRLALAEVAVGVPAAAWGVRRRSVGWAVVGAVLMVHGALELSYETVLPRD